MKKMAAFLLLLCLLMTVLPLDVFATETTAATEVAEATDTTEATEPAADLWASNQCGADLTWKVLWRL
jgi:hypothetical protein